ncbi:branched-chain amino acid ABC transporter permease [Piscinibacter sakaiensis]|uniref:branched-chain amino acid ABC transporter permease n=1 Tax=Piscinibacter sakaiensis TaxID=1547922 RepID=UPI003AAC3BFF
MSASAASNHADQRRLSRWLPLLCALAVLLLAVAPFWLNAYWMRVLSAVFTMAVIAQGINLMAGYTGYPAFGNIVFFGLGAYATAILMGTAGWSFAPAALVATLFCATLALAIGPPLLRLKGHYFAIATLGLNEAVREVVANWSALTGGGMGLSLPLPDGGPLFNARRFYFLLLAALLLATWITWEFDRRRLGLGCRAIRDNETKAEACGLHTTRYKTAAWMISAAMTGAVGAIQAWWLTYIDPPSMFDMGLAVKAFVILLLGGAGTVFGPVAGAFAVELLANFTWSKLLNWHLGAMGMIIIGVILLFPDGFQAALRPGGWIGHRLASWRAHRRGENS